MWLCAKNIAPALLVRVSLLDLQFPTHLGSGCCPLGALILSSLPSSANKKLLLVLCGTLSPLALQAMVDLQLPFALPALGPDAEGLEALSWDALEQLASQGEKAVVHYHPTQADILAIPEATVTCFIEEYYDYDDFRLLYAHCRLKRIEQSTGEVEWSFIQKLSTDEPTASARSKRYLLRDPAIDEAVTGAGMRSFVTFQVSRYRLPSHVYVDAVVPTSNPELEMELHVAGCDARSNEEVKPPLAQSKVFQFLRVARDDVYRKLRDRWLERPDDLPAVRADALLTSYADVPSSPTHTHTRCEERNLATIKHSELHLEP